MTIACKPSILLACAVALLSLAVGGSMAISPRFDERAYTLLADSPTARHYFTSWASYESDDFSRRYDVWRDNYAFIEHFNANANASYTLAMNEMGDMTHEEIASTFTGLLSVTPPDYDAAAYDAAETVAKRQIAERSIPSSYDWRDQGAVTAVKNQGSCGGCYAFSSTGAIEGVYQIATGALTSLSEQMILDCAQGTGNLGCSGGNMEITYSWLINNVNGGINTESSYPFTGTEGTCGYSASNNGASIKAYLTVTSGSESDLLTKAAMGPVSVGINASPRSFAYYSSGTLNDDTCTSSGLNHAVLVVGWGTDSSGNDYWLIKNSWGTSWGLSGYAQIARGSSNMCGIASMASLPCYTSDCSVASSATSPTPSPTRTPSSTPTRSPTRSPTASPSRSPSPASSSSATPTRSPAASPSRTPTSATASPSSTPSSCSCPCSCKK